MLTIEEEKMTDEQYTQAESFWTRKDETEKKLDADALYSWIDEFLSSHKVLALATATKDFIRCTPLEYNWYNGALWIFTEGGLKFKALKENKHIAQRSSRRVLPLADLGPCRSKEQWSLSSCSPMNIRMSRSSERYRWKH